MFTTGSKLFLGATVLSIAAPSSSASSTGGDTGYLTAMIGAGQRDASRSPSSSPSTSTSATATCRPMQPDATTSVACGAADPPATACGRLSPPLGVGADRRRHRHRADRVQGRRRRRCSPSAVEWMVQAGASGPRPIRPTTPASASGCCTRSSSRCSPPPAWRSIIYSFSRIMLFASTRAAARSSSAWSAAWSCSAGSCSPRGPV